MNLRFIASLFVACVACCQASSVFFHTGGSAGTGSGYGHILHLSDLHYDPHYLPGSPADCLLDETGLGCCRSTSIIDPRRPARFAGKWGDFNCDTPLIFLNETLRWIKENLFTSCAEPPSNTCPDVILWTGDNVGHHDFSQSLQENMDSVRMVSDLLVFWFAKGSVVATATPPVIVPVIGNHDTWPVDQLSPGSEIQSQLANMWSKRGWIPEDEYDTFSKNGYYVSNNFVATNSLYYDVNNLALNESVDMGDQWAWLWSLARMTGQQAGQQAKPLLWAGHIAPGSSGVTVNYTRGMESLASFYFSQTGKPMVSFFGHGHSDEFFVLRDLSNPDLPLVGYGLVVPSLMANHRDPRFRVLYYDKTTMEIVDYVQYTINFEKQMASNQFLGYHIDYVFRKAYGMKDLSLESWQNLIQSFRENQTLFDFYYTNYRTRNDPAKCREQCKQNLICELSFVDPLWRQWCREQKQPILNL